ncbi:MAG: calcium/sodium antiporter [Candidatus Diapherotrites archaeon]
MFEWVVLVVGLGGLVLGASLVVNGAKKIAQALNINELIIGLTVVSIGTSLPEIATTLAAAFERLQGIETSSIAIGTIIGSNISNITLILGIVGFFAVLTIGRKNLKRDGLMLVASMIIFTIASMNGFISKEEGAFLIILNMFYLLYLAKTEKIVEKAQHNHSKNPLVDFVMILVGLAAVIYTSDIVVSQSIFIAKSYGVRELTIGLLIGLGTSLPELTVSLMALLKGQTELSIGNLIGSNINNSLFVVGLGASVSGFVVDETVLALDIPIMGLVTLLALLFLYRKHDLTKPEAVVLIGCYFIYMYARLFVVGA